MVRFPRTEPAAYRVQRRERPSGPWSDPGAPGAIDLGITLTDQTPAKEFEHPVIGINKADQGQASNTVMVVL